jgi:hypothetical protein
MHSSTKTAFSSEMIFHLLYAFNPAWYIAFCPYLAIVMLMKFRNKNIDRYGYFAFLKLINGWKH